MLMPTAVFVLLHVAQADAGDSFQTKVDAGLQLYKDGDYGAAAAEFEAAYTIKPDASLLYNAGRCYERIPDIDKAIATYEQFLEAGGTTADLRAKARRSLNALKEERSARDDVAAPPPDASPPPPLPPPPAAPPVVIMQPPPAGRSYILETSLIGLGVVGIGVGTVVGILANDKASDYRKAITAVDRDAAEDEARQSALIADVAFGVGIAAIIAGAVLFFIGDDESVPVTATAGGAAVRW